MRVAVVGAVESTQVALESLIAAQMPPHLLITLPPPELHRHSDSVDLSLLAGNAGISTFHATDVNSAATLEHLTLNRVDLILVIGWSRLCKRDFRALAPLGCLGFHPSLLPKMRGRAVIPWTILTDEKTSGSTLFWIDDGIDTGDILLQRTIPVDRHETARSLYDKHMHNLRVMLPEAMALIQSGSPPRIAQDHEKATYCALRRPRDGLINWRESASDILRLVRAVGAPYPGAYSIYGNEPVYIDEATAIANSWQFVGLAGQVQTHTDRGFIVRCGDGECLEVLAWRSKDQKKPARHAVFGDGN